MSRTETLILETNRKIFFLFISSKITMNPKDAEYHLNVIKKAYDNNEKVLENYSIMIVNCFYSYLEFLLIEENFKKECAV